MDKLRAHRQLPTRRKCACQEPGEIRSAIPGILTGPPSRDGSRVVERCDLCERFQSDDSAGIMYATLVGGQVSYDKQLRVIWKPR